MESQRYRRYRTGYVGTALCLENRTVFREPHRHPIQIPNTAGIAKQKRGIATALKFDTDSALVCTHSTALL